LDSDHFVAVLVDGIDGNLAEVMLGTHYRIRTHACMDKPRVKVLEYPLLFGRGDLHEVQGIA
jgi:hypothetical protein